MNGWINSYMDEWIDSQIDIRMSKWTDRQVNRQKNKLIDSFNRVYKSDQVIYLSCDTHMFSFRFS